MKLCDIAIEAKGDKLIVHEGDALPREAKGRITFGLQVNEDAPQASSLREALKLIAESAPGIQEGGAEECLDACKSIARKALGEPEMGAGWAESAYGAPEPGYDRP